MTDETLATAPLLYLADAERRVAGEVAELEKDEARHVRALRLGAGDAVRVTDARGALWGARLVEAGTAVRLVEPLEAPPALEVELWAPVGNKQATLWLVEKATEFGLLRLRPVECERSASVADAGRSSGFWRKAERRALAAVKQSGSARLPEIDDPAPLADRLAALGVDVPRVVLDPAGPPLVSVLSEWPGRPAPVILVGPEGGLTDEELDVCRAAGFRPAALGPTILRFETAAVAALAIAAQVALSARLRAGTHAEEARSDEARADETRRTEEET